MKKIMIIMLTVCLLCFATTVYAKPRWINDLTLQYNPDATGNQPMSGAIQPGFELTLDPAVEYYYLDLENLDPIPDGTTTEPRYYPFYIKTVPKGPYYKYWATKGVNADADIGTWQEHMWKIATSEEPIFYLKSDGTQCDLIDGLLKDWALETDPALRINGDYFPGTYHFIGWPEVDGQTNRTMIKMFFK